MYLIKLNDEILKNYKHVIKLNAKNNSKITNINHMTKLKVLCAFGSCGINNRGIINLTNLEVSNANNNP